MKKRFCKHGRSWLGALCLISVCGATVTYAMAQQDSISFGAQSDCSMLKAKQDSVPVKRIRVNGFRVQVYYGGNNQKSKQDAIKMAEKVKIWFEDLPVYTTFSSPRWTCRVGDFQTREEAMELLTTMRETGRFPKAIIVKSKINIREDELRREEPNTSTAGDSAAHNSYFGTLGRGPQ